MHVFDSYPLRNAYIFYSYISILFFFEMLIPIELPRASSSFRIEEHPTHVLPS
jgi:hypothetical protein